MKRFALLVAAVVAALSSSNQAAHAVTAVVNLARGGTATQSSTGFGGVASRAIDGGLGLSYGADKTTTHTLQDAASFWTVDLGAAHNIESVQVFNRGDCCGERLAPYTVELDGGTFGFASVVEGGEVAQAGSRTRLTSGFNAQTVTIRQNVSGPEFLSLREVVIMGEADVQNSSNLAGLYGTATQSSTRNGGGGNAAQFAIDGNTNGDFGAGSVTHTASGAEQNTFWEVDLNSTFHIDNVRLFNRTGCCPGRLSNFDVDILDENRNVVTSIDNPGAVGSGFLAVDPSTQGRFVRIQLDPQNNDGNGILSLAEVQVFGGALENVARNGFAFQSSTRVGNPANPGGNAASVAIDGITDGRFFGDPSDPTDGSVTHTAGGDPNPTWTLELGAQFKIDELVIFNRAEVSGRLSGAEVKMFLAGMEVFTETLGSMAGVASVRLDTGFIDATTIQITSANGNILSLAEVQAFGSAVPEPTTMVLLGSAGLFLARRRRRNA